jgi:pyruvyl transferase EpsO
MRNLKDRLADIAALIPRGAPTLYCDFPIHNNFGDALIMLGTAAFLEHVGNPITDCFAIFAPQKISLPRAEGTVWILHGGGNFGDLWPGHQGFREQVILAHPLNRIIGLPQTLHYSSREALDRFAGIAAAHKDLHLFWRDHVSLDTARRHFDCRNYLCPDMAHFLWPIGGGGSSRTGRKRDLFLIRRDRERSGLPTWVLAQHDEFVDWRELIPREYQLVRRTARILDTVGGAMRVRVPTFELWSWAMRRLLLQMTTTFRSCDRIVTSRLHAHILACLVGARSILIDNSYGKNRSYFEAWTSGLAIAEFIDPEKVEPLAMSAG